MSLREELYGSLSIDQVKPHAILEFMEVYDRLIDEQNPKFLAYEQVSRKYSIGERTIQRWLKEYELKEVFGSKRGKHPKTIWALQNEGAQKLFVSKARELREKDPDTANGFCPQRLF